MSISDEARAILNHNWKEAFTIPTSKLYPFQWMWDSGFVALGNRHDNVERSIEEIKSMFTGQWENGMLPHIVFHSENEDSYFPNHDFWNCHVNQGAPVSVKTSGITQPPVYGFVLESLLSSYPNHPKVINLVRECFPKVVHYHQFLYQYRDPNQEGLFFIYHPWESGRDNSPIWDEVMSNIKITKENIPPYIRKDTAISDNNHRPTQDKYDRYVFLLELGKKHQYDGIGIAQESPFLIQDCMMNAILIRSNEALIQIGEAFGIDTEELKSWQALSRSNFESKFWNEDLAHFVSYDLRNEKQMTHKEIGGYIPLFAGLASQSQALSIKSYLQSVHDRGYYLCPSFDVDSPLFDSKRYWRGPVWPQMNWMLYHGLKKYNFDKLAQIVKSDFIELVDKLGFYEYFESKKSHVEKLTTGYGGNNFSWTASTYLDFKSKI